MTGKPPTVGRRFPDGHYQCRKCEYEWMPRDPDRAPKKCPKCWVWLDKPLKGADS